MKVIVGVVVEIEKGLSCDSATELFGEILRDRTDFTFLRVGSLEVLKADGTYYGMEDE